MLLSVQHGILETAEREKRRKNNELGYFVVSLFEWYFCHVPPPLCCCSVRSIVVIKICASFHLLH